MRGISYVVDLVAVWMVGSARFFISAKKGKGVKAGYITVRSSPASA